MRYSVLSTIRPRLWFLLHNCVAHPILGITALLTGQAPAWAEQLHNWTARKMGM